MRTSENSVHAKFAEDTQDEARRSGLQVASRTTILPDFVRMQALTSVQQPCSNPNTCPEMPGDALTQKYGNLQAFCNLQKPPANYRAALAWRRSGVRVPSGPLSFSFHLQVKRKCR